LPSLRSSSSSRSFDTVFVRHEAERFIATHLETPRHHYAANCGGPPVRVVPIGTSFPCAISGGAPGIRFLRVAIVNGYGDLFMDGPGWPKWRATPGAERLLGPGVAAKTEGGVVIAGPLMERYLRATAGGITHPELARRKLIGAAHCPPRIALTPGVHATCRVQLGASSLSYDLRFDQGRGLVVDTDPVVEIVPDLRDFSERYFMHAIPVIDPALAAGSRVRIDCGPSDVALLTPGEAMPCTAYAGKDIFPFAVKLLDQSGNVAVIARYADG
jgi:hypothetical protein